MNNDSEPPAVLNCLACGTQLAPALLACPRCQRLVHSEELNRLAEAAERATREGDLVRAQEKWRSALELLPPSSRQHQVISGKVSELSQQVDSGAAISSSAATVDADQRSNSKFGWTKGAAGLGALGLLLWKFKIVVVFLVTKGKLLLLGVTKGGTLLSMFASLGVYWTAWGWKFALGLVVSIYVHEMGHVAALRRYGIKANAPMFIPGLGALVRLKQMPVDAREDARIGLAGPIWGLTAAVVTYVVGWSAGWPSWIAIASVAAWINLFNLLPVWQLDGARGLRALCKHERWWLFGAVAVIWLLTAEGLLLLILIVLGGRMFLDTPPEKPDRTALIQFLVLIVALSFMAGLGALPDTTEVAGPL